MPPACHLERSPPEIPPSLCSVLLRSSTTLRFAQNDTADAVETRRANGNAVRISQGDQNLLYGRHPLALHLSLQALQRMKISSASMKQCSRTDNHPRILFDSKKTTFGLQKTEGCFHISEYACCATEHGLRLKILYAEKALFRNVWHGRAIKAVIAYDAIAVCTNLFL